MPVLTERLLAGPRGRRLLLEFALSSELEHHPSGNEPPLNQALRLASYHLDPGRGTSRVMFGPGVDATSYPADPPETVAARLGHVDLASVTPELLRAVFTTSVGWARYWQEPDGEDVLASTVSVRETLRRVAEHVSTSSITQWWTSPIDRNAQWGLQWKGEQDRQRDAGIKEYLRSARDALVAREERANREAPSDPTANWSGNWWSTPSDDTFSSTRELFDGSPAALWFVEDGPRGERATAHTLSVPTDIQVYEIDDAEAWAELCLRFPIEVTAQKRHDWYRTTGRAGRWVIPDWFQVSQHYNAVHLQVSAYLAAAGTAIQVDAERASVIAGWEPDKTYWLTDKVAHTGNTALWVMDKSQDNITWVRER